MVQVRPDPTVIAPVLVKLVAAFSVRSPPLTLIVPLLVCAAEAWLMVSDWLTVTVPWLSSCAVRLRGPLACAPGRAVMVPVAALVRVPLLTARVAPYPLLAAISSIAPLLVKPLATVSTASPRLTQGGPMHATLPPPATCSVEPLAVVSGPLTVLFPWTTTTPWLLSALLTVLAARFTVP